MKIFETKEKCRTQNDERKTPHPFLKSSFNKNSFYETFAHEFSLLVFSRLWDPKKSKKPWQRIAPGFEKFEESCDKIAGNSWRVKDVTY